MGKVVKMEKAKKASGSKTFELARLKVTKNMVAYAIAMKDGSPNPAYSNVDLTPIYLSKELFESEKGPKAMTLTVEW
jgi:hypothetical protein